MRQEIGAAGGFRRLRRRHDALREILHVHRAEEARPAADLEPQPPRRGAEQVQHIRIARAVDHRRPHDHGALAAFDARTTRSASSFDLP